MPHLLDTDDRVAVLTRAVNHILATEGPSGVTMRAVAHHSGVSTSSIAHHLGGREHLLRVCCHRAARTRLQDVSDSVRRSGPVGALPESDADVLDTRTWLAWVSLIGLVPGLGRSVTETRIGESAVVWRSLGSDAVRHRMDEVMALVHGLREAMCRPEDPQPTVEARACLARRLGELLGTEVVPGRRLVGPEVWVWPFVPGPRAVATTPVEHLG